MKRLLVSTILATVFLFSTGCASDPNGQAAELRSLYKEVQNTANFICAEPGADHAKCEATQRKLASFEPIVASVEVAAAAASQNPGEALNFQLLWAQARPKIEAALLELVLRKYLGN